MKVNKKSMILFDIELIISCFISIIFRLLSLIVYYYFVDGGSTRQDLYTAIIYPANYNISNVLVLLIHFSFFIPSVIFSSFLCEINPSNMYHQYILRSKQYLKRLIMILLPVILFNLFTEILTSLIFLLIWELSLLDIVRYIFAMIITKLFIVILSFFLHTLFQWERALAAFGILLGSYVLNLLSDSTLLKIANPLYPLSTLDQKGILHLDLIPAIVIILTLVWLEYIFSIKSDYLGGEK